MKNNNQKPNSSGEKGFGLGAVKLLIESLADLITKLRIDLLQQGNEVLVRIRAMSESVDIIAREVARQVEKERKS